jgi:hypothetical protein
MRIQRPRDAPRKPAPLRDRWRSPGTRRKPAESIHTKPCPVGARRRLADHRAGSTTISASCLGALGLLWTIPGPVGLLRYNKGWISRTYLLTSLRPD